MRKVFNVDAACRNISGHQYFGLSSLEALKRNLPRSLSFVSVDGYCVNTQFVERFGQLIGAMFGTAEHQRVLDRFFLQDMQQQIQLVVFLSSEERRVGKECVNTCRSRGSPNL